MARNTGEDYRKGSVKDRVQYQKGGKWYKVDTDTGKVLDIKEGEPFKGVAKKKDDRRS